MKKAILIIGLIVLLCLAVALIGQQNTDHQHVDELYGQPVFREDLEIIAVTFDSSVNNHGLEPVPEEDLEEIVQWLRQFKIGRRFDKDEPLPAGYGAVEVAVTYADQTTQKTACTHILLHGERYRIERPDAPDAVPPLD